MQSFAFNRYEGRGGRSSISRHVSNWSVTGLNCYEGREREREGVQENNGTSYSNELQKNCRRLAGCVRRVVVIPPTVICGFCDTK